MRSLVSALVVALGVLMATAPAVVAGDKAPMEATAAFAKLKTLAGEWSGDCEGQHGDAKAKVEYRVTGGGNVVMETQLPGTAHEMISMYFLDGKDLRMTHYCAIGNQPRLKFDPSASTADALVFDFDGGTNLDPAKDTHIHALTITFKDAKHVDSAWEGYMGGKSAGFTTFAMSRP